MKLTLIIKNGQNGFLIQAKSYIEVLALQSEGLNLNNPQ